MEAMEIYKKAQLTNLATAASKEAFNRLAPIIKVKSVAPVGRPAISTIDQKINRARELEALPLKVKEILVAGFLNKIKVTTEHIAAQLSIEGIIFLQKMEFSLDLDAAGGFLIYSKEPNYYTSKVLIRE